MQTDARHTTGMTNWPGASGRSESENTMRISCDNCGATYRIPEHKLVRNVNKATCRKCGHAIIIKKGDEVAPVGAGAPVSDRERTQITSQAELQARAIAQSQGVGAQRVPDPSPSHGLPTEISPAQSSPRSRALNAPRTPKPVVTPAPRGAPLAAARPHDPSGDLSIVMMACFAAAFGALVLATSQSAAQTFIGLFITLWSATTSLFVLVTGNRGRKEAGVVMSLVVGLLVAGVFAGGLHYLRAPAQNMEVAAAPAEAAPAAVVAEAPAEAPKAAEEEAAEEEEPEAAEEEEEDAVADAVKPEAKPEARPEAKPETTRTTQPATTTRTTQPATTRNTTRNTTPPPEVKPEVKPPPAPVSTGVPLTVLDTMIKSNRSVKTCFALYREETGSLPSGRITVTLTVDPSGAVTSAGIASGPYDATSLDSCLGGAVAGIRFPAFDGSAKTYRYPFIL